MTEDSPEYRSRDFDTYHHEIYLRHLLDRLSDLARDSDPAKAGTAENKDSRACSALRTAGTLVDAVAGWAIDHVLGLSLAGEAMQPLQPSGTKRHPEYLRYKQSVDRHEPEERGSGDRSTIPASGAARQLILRNFIFAGGTGLPPWLREELLLALDALDRGEVLPLVQPKRRFGMRRQVAAARLRLVAIARFRSEAYGGTIDDARNDVACWLGLEGESLKNWEARLKGDRGVGSLTYERTISFATNAASHVRAARRHNLDPVSAERSRAVAAHHESNYGDEALALAVAEWQRVGGAGSNSD